MAQLFKNLMGDNSKIDISCINLSSIPVEYSDSFVIDADKLQNGEIKLFMTNKAYTFNTSSGEDFGFGFMARRWAMRIVCVFTVKNKIYVKTKNGDDGQWSAWVEH